MELQYLRTDGPRIVGGRSGSLVSGDYMRFKGIKKAPSSGDAKVYIMVDGGRLYKIGDQ